RATAAATWPTAGWASFPSSGWRPSASDRWWARWGWPGEIPSPPPHGSAGRRARAAPGGVRVGRDDAVGLLRLLAGRGASDRRLPAHPRRREAARPQRILLRRRPRARGEQARGVLGPAPPGRRRPSPRERPALPRGERDPARPP